VAEHSTTADLEDFVTGLVGRIELRTGAIEMVNAGHVSPYLANGSGVRVVELPVDLPFGLFADTTYRSTTFTLTPGDRLFLVTDGMLERNAAGLDLAHAIADTRMLHPREAVRTLADRVLADRVLADRVLGVSGVLADDATVLCLDWHGGHGRDRRTVHGADRNEWPGPGRT
jgi:serine phosphatase RsbU (regulator of sigma subunit)